MFCFVFLALCNFVRCVLLLFFKQETKYQTCFQARNQGLERCGCWKEVLMVEDQEKKNEAFDPWLFKITIGYGK